MTLQSVLTLIIQNKGRTTAGYCRLYLLLTIAMGPYRCTSCGSNFDSETSLRRHIPQCKGPIGSGAQLRRARERDRKRKARSQSLSEGPDVDSGMMWIENHDDHARSVGEEDEAGQVPYHEAPDVPREVSEGKAAATGRLFPGGVGVMDREGQIEIHGIREETGDKEEGIHEVHLGREIPNVLLDEGVPPDFASCDGASDHENSGEGAPSPNKTGADDDLDDHDGEAESEEATIPSTGIVAPLGGALVGWRCRERQSHDATYAANRLQGGALQMFRWGTMWAKVPRTCKTSLSKFEMSYVQLGYSSSETEMDNLLKTHKESIDYQLGKGSFDALFCRFDTFKKMLALCRKAGTFAMHFRDIDGGSNRSHRVGVLPPDHFWGEIERIFAHNGIESILPTGIDTEELTPPDEMYEVMDTPMLHDMFHPGRSPRPRDAVALPLGLWTDEVSLSKSTSKKIRVAVIRPLSIWKENMKRVGMSILYAAMPDFTDPDDSRMRKAFNSDALYNTVMKHILEPLIQAANLECALPCLNLGGHDVRVWPYLHFLSADLKELHVMFGTYLSLNNSNSFPIPYLHVKTGDLDQVCADEIDKLWCNRESIMQPLEEAMHRFKGSRGHRSRFLAQWSQRPIIPAVMGFQFQDPTRQAGLQTVPRSPFQALIWRQ